MDPPFQQTPMFQNFVENVPSCSGLPSVQNATWPMSSYSRSNHGLQLLHGHVSTEWGHRSSTAPERATCLSPPRLAREKIPISSAKTSPRSRGTVCSQQRVCCYCAGTWDAALLDTEQQRVGPQLPTSPWRLRAHARLRGIGFFFF